jgi:hypothetical protein
VKTYKTKCGRFEISYVSKPEDMAGNMIPFEPMWEVQSLINGEQQFFKTEKECKEYIKEFN